MKIKSFAHWDHPSNRQAFTLVEALIGTVIMLIMFISFYAAISAGVGIIQVARENLRATQILDTRMEGIRLFTWAQLTNTTLLPTNFTETFNPIATNGDQGITYTGTVSIATAALTSPASSYSNNLWQITVQLNWQSTGAMHTRQMSTYCAQYGMQNYVWSSD